ncbi:universal stress protein [Flavobacteriaceae bacterium AU392]|nr:universal stress protein [Flavobacteriaceae bacterium]RKM85926.1 universal stress protein [Flavobacteriaceae bacterium AU392]
MKKIIVPVDFSLHSEYALETAAILAKKHNAEIFALHMLEISEAILTSIDSEQQMKTAFLIKYARERFNNFLDKDYLKGITITPIVKHFKVFSEVNEVVDENDVDLIIMGSKGNSGLKEVFVGSNTQKVIRHSNIPVLVLKDKPNLKSFKNVVFACDFSEESIKAYINITRMVKILGAQLNLLYVNLPYNSFKSNTEMEKQVLQFLKRVDGNERHINDVHFICDYSIEKGVSNFCNKTDIDLITIATHGRKGLAHFIDGSISEDLANHSTLPVMTFKI